MLARRACELRTENFEVDSCIQGYHVFKSICNPTTGKNWTACEKRQTLRIFML